MAGPVPTVALKVLVPERESSSVQIWVSFEWRSLVAVDLIGPPGPAHSSGSCRDRCGGSISRQTALQCAARGERRAVNRDAVVDGDTQVSGR